jgi:8-oxo-dGTP diphosphatase
MNKKYCYDYQRPAVTTDCIIYDQDDQNGFKILLIRRKNDPFKDMWAFPGGFLDMDETAEECAVRELLEETGINGIILEQVLTATGINRDPRGRTISIVFLGRAESTNICPVPGDDAQDVEWFKIDKLPPLAFDHYEILQKTLKLITGRLPLK